MTEAWTPELRAQAHGDQCRLTLAGVTYGHGLSLQDAADDLLARVLDLALALRAGYRVTGEARQDPRIAQFLWEVGELAVRRGDVRSRVLGFTTDQPNSPMHG